MTSMIVTPRYNDWTQALWISAHYVCILLLIRYHWFNDFCFSCLLNSVISALRVRQQSCCRCFGDVRLSFLGESCIFKHRIPGECSSVASTIQLGTPKYDKKRKDERRQEGV